MDTFERITEKMTSIIAIGLSVFTIYTALFGIIKFQRHVHVALILVIVSLKFPFFKGDISHIKRVIEANIKIFMSSLAIAATIWGMIRWEPLTYMPYPNTVDIIFCVILLIIILESARRTVGFIMPTLAILSLGYAYWGDYFPGEFFHKAFSISRIAYELYPGEGGFYSTPIGVCATFIILFIIFGSFLSVSGGTDIFIKIANSIAGRYSGGPAKVAVIASAMMGMISGSAVANVATTGQITIPLMKRVGFHPNTAGAIESIASTGGQLTPPIMGATAFIIADITGISYIRLCYYAAVPAALFYFSLLLSVHYYAKILGIKGLDGSQIPKFFPSLLKGIHLSVPIIVLVMLLVSRYSIMMSVVWSLVALIVLSMTSSATRLNIRKIFKALELGSVNMVTLSTACACAGIIISVVNLTGIGFKLSYSLIEISGGNPFVVLLLVMIVSIVLSMGLPPIACYIILVILVGPALEEVGFTKIAGHMFIFYFVVLSVITPPYCIGSYTAAAISGGDPFKTGFIAMKYGLYSYVLPFVFIYFPQLLLQGSAVENIAMITKAVFSIFCFESASEGFLLVKLKIIERLLLFAACALIYSSNYLVMILPISILAWIVINQIHKRKGLPDAAAA